MRTPAPLTLEILLLTCLLRKSRKWICTDEVCVGKVERFESDVDLQGLRETQTTRVADLVSV